MLVIVKSSMRKGTYKDLEIYQLAHALAVECHRISLKLPELERYEEASPLRRSSKSVSSSIVEGFGRRRYKADFVRFLVYSHASCDETKEHLQMLYDTDSLTEKKLFEKMMKKYDQLGAKISRFIDAVEQQHRTP
jgi:four helix bundle protein